jgi:UDP-N-acetylmuramoyl-tripeptide--D-alanyl-D-alanine ligase
MKLTVRDLLEIRPREILNGDLLPRALTGVSTDSRSVAPGDLFVALKGPSFDGHAFLREALARGAGAAVVEPGAVDRNIPRMPLVLVENSTVALGRLARVYRNRFSIPVLAVGGSSGKTTTKEMIAAVLGRTHRVLKTEKNYNNQIGVPRTLFALERKHEIAVVELGTNHPGELQVLCEILDPTHGLLTNIGAEHLEFFRDLRGVAKEEGRLFGYIAGRSRGTALVNADDRRVVREARAVSRRIRYGFAPGQRSIRGKFLGMTRSACAIIAFTGPRMKRPVSATLAVPGRHHASNALAAAAAGFSFGVPAREIVAALESFSAADNRMQLLETGGVRILNDTYNANGDSTVAALETLATMEVTGKRIAVLADMLELGERAGAEHRRVGTRAGRLAIEYLLTYGPRARGIAEASGVKNTLHYEQKNMLAEYLAELVSPGDAVLVKGSRGMGMESVVLFLMQRLRDRANHSQPG